MALSHRARVRARRLSSANAPAIEVAPEDLDLKAIVAGGATAGCFADYLNLDGLDREPPIYWTLYTTARALRSRQRRTRGHIEISDRT